MAHQRFDSENTSMDVDSTRPEVEKPFEDHEEDDRSTSSTDTESGKKSGSQESQKPQDSEEGQKTPEKDLASSLIEALQQMGRDRAPKTTPEENEIAKQSVLPPKFQVEKELQLSDIDFGHFLKFFIRVQDLLGKKGWSPDVEAWVLQQFAPGSTVAHRIRDAIGTRPSPRSDSGALIFTDLIDFRSWCFTTLFCESLPQDVVEYYLSDLRVGLGSQSNMARDCTNLAQIVREALSYVPHEFRMTTPAVVSRVKGKLPISAKAML